MPSDSNKRIAKNTLMLYIRMLLTMGVGLYTSRVILATLGVEDYGIYNVVGGVIAMFSFINSSMSGATSRFLTFELGRNDYEKLKKTFSAALTVHFIIAGIILVFGETIGLWFLENKLVIDTERMNAARWIYQMSILSAMVGITQVPYNATIISHEKMNVYAYVEILNSFLKLGIVYLLVIGNFDKLILYAILTLCVTIIITTIYKIYCAKNFSESHYRFMWNKAIIYPMLNFSSWSLFGSFAVMSATQGVNILLNLFYGVIVNAAMGIATQVSNTINQFVSNFQTAFRPQIIKLYATGDNQNLEQLVFRTSKMSFFILFILVFPIIINMDFILKIWLKTVPEYSASFCIFILISSLLEALSGPLWMTVQAVGKIKKYQLFISVAIGLNIIFSYFFLKLGFSPNIVVQINVLVAILGLIIRLWFVQSYTNIQIVQFIKNVLFRIIPIVTISIIIPTFLRRFYVGWERLFLTSLSFFLLGFLSVYYFGFTKYEQKIVFKMIGNKVGKLKKSYNKSHFYNNFFD